MISPWTQKEIPVDAFGSNPMLDALKFEQPEVAAAALRGGNAPTLFVGGDLPAFTASGMAPAMLTKFPWNQRHHVAATADPTEVYMISQDYATNDDYTFNTPGLYEFMGRMRNWATKSGTGSNNND